jgi:ribosomal protein S18 acetylase RimI-like enzyme
LIWLGVEEKYQHEHIAEKLFYRFRHLMIKEGVRMLIVDTQAENLPALKFFRKMGFGSPSQHIYLSMNLDSEIQQYKKRKKENG